MAGTGKRKSGEWSFKGLVVEVCEQPFHSSANSSNWHQLNTRHTLGVPGLDSERLPNAMHRRMYCLLQMLCIYGTTMEKLWKTLKLFVHVLSLAAHGQSNLDVTNQKRKLPEYEPELYKIINVVWIQTKTFKAKVNK